MSNGFGNNSFNHVLVDDAKATIQKRLAEAQASKDAGNTALQLDQPRQACFHYKKVYLHLAQFLGPSMAVSTCKAVPTAGTTAGGLSKDGAQGVETTGDNDENASLLNLLHRRRGSSGADIATQRALMETTATPTALPADFANSSTDEAAAAVDVGSSVTGACCEPGRGLGVPALPTTTMMTTTSPTTLQEQVYLLYGLALNNLTLAHMRLGRYSEGARTATCVLERVPGFTNNIKALMRRARCYVQLSEFDLAAKDIATLQAQTPLDLGVAGLVEELKVSRDTYALREKKMFKGMFGPS